MASKYQGVQARIMEVNQFAYLLPSTLHSLNIIGVNAASILPRMMTFFGTIQNLFTFFAASTAQWDVLK